MIFEQSCIKVAPDFVSPENFGECIALSNEFLLLPEGHLTKEDKLEVLFKTHITQKWKLNKLHKFILLILGVYACQVKKMAIYALHKAVDDIEVNKPEAGDKKTNLEKRYAINFI